MRSIVQQPAPGPASRLPASFRFGRWVIWVSIGEAIGFAVPIGMFAVLALSGAPAAMVWMGVALAGAAEGALLGYSQARAGGLPVGPWTLATALAASVAWAIGMAPSSLADLGVDFARIPLAVGVPAVVIAAFALLGSIPTAQYIVLRRLVCRAWRWIPSTMAAWLIALPWTLVVGLLFDETSPIAWVLACYALAGGLMAATIAVLTGLAMRRMRT